MDKPIKCLVLDGYHKGHCITVSTPLYKLSLLKPVTITAAVVYGYGDEVMGVDRTLRKDYKLAGYSVDRSVAFYSTNGSMECLFNRDWVAHEDGYN